MASDTNFFKRAGQTRLARAYRSCFLFQRDPQTLPPARRAWLAVWNWGMVTLMGLLLGVLSLALAYGTRDGAVFAGYFRSPMILLLNLLPPLILMLALYAAAGRAWIAWLVSSVVILLPSLIHYYMLCFRDDPFDASKLLLLREGAAIAGNYHIELSGRVILAIAAVPVGTLLLLALVRGRWGWRSRAAVAAAVLVALWPLSRLYVSQTIYDERTENYDVLTRKRATDRFIGKGYWYPFLYSAGELLTAEEGQQASVDFSGGGATVTVQPSEADDVPAEEQAPQVTYESADIPEGKKVNVIMIMLEAFSDLSDLNIEGIAPEVYDGLHQMESESYSGRLVTNIFAAGTVNTERCALTGDFWVPDDGYDQDTGSYVRYLAGQGYNVTGSHPIYGWFYNRENINRFLGFESYDFWEGYYETLVNDIAEYLYKDNLFLDDVYQRYLKGTRPMYSESAAAAMDSGSIEAEEQTFRPYFSFHVTYQGHATYPTAGLAWGDGHYVPAGEVSSETYYILNNYLGSVRDTVTQLELLRQRLAEDSEPVVLVLFGDHKPWLGDGNSVYNELGVNLDTDTEEGFYNYYTTPYLIWANDAAKAQLDSDFVGQGPDISPAYLMNELFRLCGWDGPAYMQLMDDLEPLLPVVNTDGYYVEGTEFTETLSPVGQHALDSVRQVADFRRKHAGEMKIVTEELTWTSEN